MQARKQPPINITAPDPFNHGLCGVRFRDVSPGEWAIAESVLQKGWGIDPVDSVVEYARGTAYSRNYLLETSDGSFVFRECRVSNPVIQTAIDDCRDFARSAGLPTPEVIRTISGASFHTVGENVFSLTRAVHGEHFDGSRQQLTRAAELFAEFHIAFENCPLSDYVAQVKGEVYPDDEQKWNLLKSKAKHGSTEFDRWIHDMLCKFEHLHCFNTEQFSHLPKQLGHLDWNPHNLIYSRTTGEIIGLLDFDLVRYTERARDVALGLHKLSRVFGARTQRKHDIGATIGSRAEHFLATYTEVNELQEEEIQSISSLLLNESRRKLIYILSKHYLQNDSSSDFDLVKQQTLAQEATLLNCLAASAGRSYNASLRSQGA